MDTTGGIDISLIICCRIDGNKNSRLLPCLTSFADSADTPQRVEVLIKFDDDDPNVPSVLDELKRFDGSLHIRPIITPRGAGYTDLHKAYNDLLAIADPESQLFWVISDDVGMNKKGWDTKLCNCLSLYDDRMFVAHTLVDFIHPALADAMEGPDPYPIWSKRWLAVQGGLGYCAATDAWTSMVLFVLLTKYGYNRHVFIPGIPVKRHLLPEDLPGSEKWNGTRQSTITFLNSPQVQSLLDETAHNLASRIATATAGQERTAFDRRRITLPYIAYGLRKQLMKYEQGRIRYPALWLHSILRTMRKTLRLY